MHAAYEVAAAGVESGLGVTPKAAGVSTWLSPDLGWHRRQASYMAVKHARLIGSNNPKTSNSSDGVISVRSRGGGSSSRHLSGTGSRGVDSTVVARSLCSIVSSASPSWNIRISPRTEQSWLPLVSTDPLQLRSASLRMFALAPSRPCTHECFLNNSQIPSSRDHT